MTPLALTPERRAQLGELLADERRLEADYPQVANYLDAAAGLAGTGNAEADRLFDLRMLNYLTGDRANSANPYWDVVAPSVSSRDGRRVVDGGEPTGSSRLAFAQTVLQSAYAYAIPSPETVAWVSAAVEGRPIVELAAGRGYWAGQLAQSGLTVNAYDIEPPDRIGNVSFPQVAGQPAVWYTVGGIEEFDDRSAHGSDFVLFLCWPPGWENPMASSALDSFEKSGGDRLIYIGEPEGGKTADSAFFDRLRRGWRLTAEDPDFVSWWNLSDHAQAWTRR